MDVAPCLSTVVMIPTARVRYLFCQYGFETDYIHWIRAESQPD